MSKFSQHVQALVEGFSWGPFVGSLINLAAVTVERYLRVVHPVWANKKLRDWMLYSTAVLAWAGGIAVAEGATVLTLSVVNGFSVPSRQAAFYWSTLGKQPSDNVRP